MKNYSALCILLFLAACSSDTMKKQEAETLITSYINKSPYRSVSFYTGYITDANYLPTYKKIATGKLLTLTHGHYVKAAGRKMSKLSLTDEGKKVAQCNKNRCTIDVCTISLKSIDSIKISGNRHAEINYETETRCNLAPYKSLKPLADKQYIAEKTEKEIRYLEKKKEGWQVVR